MRLVFDRDQLLQLMKDFHILTGIRIVLFDDEYQELLSYPGNDCAFCHRMKSNPSGQKSCRESDAYSFRKCNADQRLIIYHCHAGLIEATAPLIDNHIVIGYLMFGQISDAESEEDLAEILSQALSSDHSVRINTLLSDIPLKTDEQIRTAAKIMEACTFYVIQNEAVLLRRQNFTNNLRTFLTEHLSENLDAETIASWLGISRSKLYIACDKYIGMGIAEYVRNLRMEEAKNLLKTTDLSVTEIAGRTGFEDYNYFSRVFKKETGYSAREYRGLFH
ncbi:MAG: PocR ligand-binding domain-containing protein [Clostridiales bacterium]|nr:PocR ligand-binding domain-containing protein [Clostridiales bacterium]